ncbi:hypothetical protein IHI24_000486 [Rickettsia endosymbiont of Cardiosporidium cionae]|nr:hypothetical protein IHI24_000486 [Rickettsia endosymbiont of Cardiosporidium cionae]
MIENRKDIYGEKETAKEVLKIFLENIECLIMWYHCKDFLKILAIYSKES